MASSPTVHVASFEERLGRIIFVAGEHRIESQASATRTGIGGWFPALEADGKIDFILVFHRDTRRRLSLRVRDGAANVH